MEVLGLDSFLKDKFEESKILFIYRYLSLIITSIFYFLNQGDHTISRKIFIISCLAIAAVILSYLYMINEDSKKNIKILLLIETISNSILLIPSGGMNSPFIWYTLNTILISSLFLERKYPWINIGLYILFMSSIGYLVNRHDLSILNFETGQGNLFLSIIMIILSIQVLSIYIKQTKDRGKRLEEANISLQNANQMVIESIEHIKALYQSVSIFSNKGNVEGLINTLFTHIKNITKTNSVFYYDISDMDSKMILKGNEKIGKQLEIMITNSLKKITEIKTPTEIIISDIRYVMICVGNNYPFYGVLGFEVVGDKEGFIYHNNLQQLKFLSQLISIVLERIELEEVNERLLIDDEQNRIANEIHDSVLQRLFGMSCGIFALMKGLKTYSEEEIIDELNEFREATDGAMKELRDKIYGLSWKKSGQNSFISDINNYIDTVKKFSDENIPFTISGSVELLSSQQRRALYRIICEGIGNGIRHGKAKNIEVNLLIDSNVSRLNIQDDGMGFDTNEESNKKSKGLGVQNMEQLALSLQGELKINSTLGIGTNIELTFPNNNFIS